MDSARRRTWSRLCMVATTSIASLWPIPTHAGEDEAEFERLLGLSLEDLAEVDVVTASKRPQRLAEVPGTVRVITAEQISENGYLTLEEALAELPGVQFRNLLSVNSYVFLRGVPNQNNLTLVLVDGVQINELNSGGFYGGGHYNLSNVKRIEVMFGPASALYGTNAVSGIINIITKDPQDDPGLRLAGLYGSFDTKSVELSHSHYDPESRFGVRVSGMFKSSTKADLTGRKGDNNWTSAMENFEDDYALDIKLTYGDLTAGLNFQNRRSSTATYFRAVDTIYWDTGTYWNIRFLNTYLKHVWALREQLVVRSKVYFRDATVLDDSVLKVTDDGQNGRFRPNHLVGAEVMAHATVGSDVSVTGGLVLEQDWLADGYSQTNSSDPQERPPRPVWPEMTTNTLVSAYGQAQYEVFDLLKLSAGVRFDHSSVYDQVLTPRVGAILNWRGLTSKLLYAEAFRAPKPWDYADGLGNPDLGPEKMDALQMDLGYWLDRNLRVEVSVYQNTLEGMLSKETVGTNWRWINLGQVVTRGVEPSMTFKQGSFETYVNYTFNRSRDENDDPVPEIAEHGANFGFRYAPGEHLRLNLRGNYLGRRPNPKTIATTRSDHVAAAVVMHATLSLLDYGGFDWHLIGRNLLDTKYYHTSNREPDRYRQPQRSLLFKAAYGF